GGDRGRAGRRHRGGRARPGHRAGGRRALSTTLALSVVVVAHDMARELPRTLETLSPAHQLGLDAADYEVIVVDNGSPDPVAPRLLDTFGGRIRLERIDPAPPSPAAAANLGIDLATGELVGLIVDGARMA